MRGESDEESEELRGMLKHARSYLQSSNPGATIVAEYFGAGIGGVVAIFLFEMEFADGRDESLWVIEGDLPSGHVRRAEAETPDKALVRYAEMIEQWLDAGSSNADHDVTVNFVRPTNPNHFPMLGRRTKALRDFIIPAISERIQTAVGRLGQA